MSRAKVVVAMSGGVDSSVAAALLKREGYDVYGVTLRLSDWKSGEGRRFGGCCGSTDFYDARAVAQAIGIPHYSLNYVERFRSSVIGYFKDSYLKGETPNPCIACNQFVKFDDLLEQAVAMGADYVATGHYVRLESRVSCPASAARDPGLGTRDYLLKKAADPSKDQSYVLYHLGQKELSRLLFPLGGLRKSEVRAIARDLGLKVAQKPDSQEICFVPNQDYRQFIREEIPADRIRPGEIRHRDGRVLGMHRGLPFYTIGQREGLGISVGKPLYVTAINAGTNTLVVGGREDALSRGMTVRQVRWVSDRSPQFPLRASVKIRYKHAEATAVVEGWSGGAAENDSSAPPPLHRSTVVVRFDSPQSAVTPGQAAVFYNGDVVLGGGIIDHGQTPSH